MLTKSTIANEGRNKILSVFTARLLSAAVLSARRLTPHEGNLHEHHRQNSVASLHLSISFWSAIQTTCMHGLPGHFIAYKSFPLAGYCFAKPSSSSHDLKTQD
jgi:hypothetical protein